MAGNTPERVKVLQAVKTAHDSRSSNPAGHIHEFGVHREMGTSGKWQNSQCQQLELWTKLVRVTEIGIEFALSREGLGVPVSSRR
jgi:hypothetical protein